MANVKITDLLAYTDAASTDVLPIVDVSNNVTKKISISTLLKATPLGSAAAPAIAIDGDPNTGIYSPGADQLAVSTAGTGRLFIDSSGNVGIGTSSPAARLHVIGFEAHIESPTANDGFLRFTNTSGSMSIGMSGAATNALLIADRINSQVAYTYNGGASGSHVWATNNIERARIDSSGRVGIGTSSPGQLLTLNGNNFVGSSFNGQAIGDTSAERIRIGYKDGTPDTGIVPAQIIVDASILSIAARDTAASAIRFHTGTGVAERLRIDSAGRLLVGTSNAFGSGVNDSNYSLIQIRGNTGGGGSEGRLTLGNTTASASIVAGNDLGSIWFADGSGGDYARILAEADGAGGSSDYPGRLVFSTTADGASSPTERMRIANGGEIYFPSVGTTASAANAFLNSASSPANQLLRSTSSRRYKTDIEDLQDQNADAILGLRPVWYRSLAEADRKDWSWYGLIAEEVAQVEPRLVFWTYLEDAYEEVDDKRQLKADAEMVPDGVQYDRLTVLLLDLVQRQNERIETLEAKVAALEAA
jgi:hypothetical protein